ncbi:UNVERIFIED_CONTAM: Retrovirus-related Pol polyprotein from transposon TNT 1-94 [Sesamum calycinum]|uniref:Retrovirus-related Pol polyprotein from transposon TNT 1-94 n=1 Tax=Sesamum calycinum TaxID=2727403 RepID=A0AAW2SHJ3_9LAMI
MRSDMESMSSNKVLKRKLRGDGKNFLPIYAYLDYKAWQMDVKIAFLNGFIKEDIDLDQLVDFIFIGEKLKVNGSPVVFLVLYINDVLIIGNDVKMLSDTKAWVSMQFCMKDLSDASYILDIKIYRDRSRRMGSFPRDAGLKLFKTQTPKTDDENIKMSDIAYAPSIGRIQYVVQCTWTKEIFLVYGDGELVLKGYSDASFQYDVNDAKS